MIGRDADASALAIRERRDHSANRETAALLMDLAGFYITIGKDEKAEPLFARALKICLGIPGEQHTETARALGGLATTYSYTRRYGQAEAPEMALDYPSGSALFRPPCVSVTNLEAALEPALLMSANDRLSSIRVH